MAEDWKEGIKFHSQYGEYVKRIPEAKQALLNELLAKDSLDLQEIAKYPTQWKIKLVAYLGLTQGEKETIVANAIIKSPNNPAGQERIDMLLLWVDKHPFTATYGNLLNSCLLGGDATTAMEIYKLVANKEISVKRKDVKPVHPVHSHPTPLQANDDVDSKRIESDSSGTTHTEQKSQVLLAADNSQEIPGSCGPTTTDVDGQSNRIQAVPACYLNAAMSYSTLWIDRNGEVMKEVHVYFYNNPLPNTKLDKVQLTNNKVIELVNEYWTEGCRKLGERGQYVPRFWRVERKEIADIRVEYVESGNSCSTVGVRAQNNESVEDRPTTLFAISGFPEYKIQHTLLHEFGHILGLYHEHQHPEYLEVMKEFLDEGKCYNLWKASLPVTADKSLGTFRRNCSSVRTVEGFPYDKKSIMHYPTSLAMLKDEHAGKIRNEKDLDKLKASGDINDMQHFMLTGFLFHLNERVTCVPSEDDKRMISEAYYRMKSTPPSSPHSQRYRVVADAEELMGEAAADGELVPDTNINLPKVREYTDIGGELNATKKPVRGGSRSEQSSASSSLLGINDLKIVLSKVHAAAAKWEDLGLALNIKPDTLAQIKCDHHDVQNRLKAAVSEWLWGNGGERSWEFLSKALKDPLVGRRSMAEEILNTLSH